MYAYASLSIYMCVCVRANVRCEPFINSFYRLAYVWIEYDKAEWTETKKQQPKWKWKQKRDIIRNWVTLTISCVPCFVESCHWFFVVSPLPDKHSVRGASVRWTNSPFICSIIFYRHDTAKPSERMFCTNMLAWGSQRTHSEQQRERRESKKINIDRWFIFNGNSFGQNWSDSGSFSPVALSVPDLSFASNVPHFLLR